MSGTAKVRWRGHLADRQQLIAALERVTGQKATYLGPPGFCYMVGSCTVLRDGSVECGNEELLDWMAAEGLIEGKGGGDVEDIPHFPMEEFTGKSLTNLVYMLAAREKLIGKAVGRVDAFHIEDRLVRRLRTTRPASVADFLEVLAGCGGSGSMRGVTMENGELSLSGLPATPACRELAEGIMGAARKQKWVKPCVRQVESERYSFRIWLMSIGMKGSRYKGTRTELLKRLGGNCAFRTEGQKTAYLHRKKKNFAHFTAASSLYSVSSFLR